jgi:hypothetical protein
MNQPTLNETRRPLGLTITIDRGLFLFRRKSRPCQGLDNRWIFPKDIPAVVTAPVLCRERLGGLLRYYHRKAA